MPLPAGYLHRTNILVHLLRNKDLGKYLDHTCGFSAGTNPFILSAVTVGELYSLADQFNWGVDKRSALGALLANLTWVDINETQILTAYGAIDAWSRANGRK